MMLGGSWEFGGRGRKFPTQVEMGYVDRREGVDERGVLSY
jgi:hypothetical protein